MANNHNSEPPKVYWLEVRAGLSDVDRREIYSEYEEARHNYEVWKYDNRVMEAHGYVSLIEMSPDENGKYVISRDLGEKRW